ncbi:hypothetical protein AB1L16_21115 [Peribacillus frigoritolerans]|uniref:hypothetical protein n=1 Tax=Peribacillus frigoritolerans TaxID=450367 RepID=UPI00399F4969
MRHWQTVGGKGADFWNQLECNFKKKTEAGHPEPSFRTGDLDLFYIDPNWMEDMSDTPAE